MRLNQASDFALRILMLLAKGETPLTVDKIAERLGLAKTHIMKIVAKLNRAGILETSRGRYGGVQLGKPASEIRIGDVVCITESDFAIVDCLRQDGTCCGYVPQCALIPVMIEAKNSFLESLNKHDLESIVDQTQVPKAAKATKSKRVAASHA